MEAPSPNPRCRAPAAVSINVLSFADNRPQGGKNEQ